MQNFRKNYANFIIFLLVLAMAYFSSEVIINFPGMSVSGWLFTLAPIVVIGLSIAIIKMNAYSGSNLSLFFSPFPIKIDKRIFLGIIVLAIIFGVSVIFNPFDFIMLIFIEIIIFLFIRSVYMVIHNKSIDGIGMLLISLPFITYVEDQLVRLETGFSFEWITIKIAIIVLFASIWVSINIFMHNKSIVKGRFNGLVTIFVIATLFSALFSTDVNYSLKRWLFEIAYPILIYFLIINSIRHEIDIGRFMSYLITSVFLDLIMVLYYFAKYGGSNPVFDKHLLNVHFADAVLVANTLTMTIPVVIAFLVTTHTKSLKLLLSIMIALGIVGVILSFSRVLQIVMGIELLAFLLIKKTRKYVMIFGVISVVIFIFNSEKLDPYLSKYKSLSSIESILHESSMETRFGGWRAAWGMFRDHPLIGVGIGRYNQEYANYARQLYAVYAHGYVSMISAHNGYLNYLAETGILGILLLLAIFTTIAVKGFRLIRRVDNNYVFKYSLLISIAGFLVDNFVIGMTFACVKEIDKGMIFWSIVAIIMSYGAIEKNQGNHFPGREHN